MKMWAEPIEILGLEKQNVALPYQKEEWFYKYKDGTLFPYYKEDIKKVINPLQPCTFLPLFQELDIPFFEDQWLLYLTREIEKNSVSNVFGKYLSWCKLKAIKSYGFKDSTRCFLSMDEYHNFKYIVR